jgi:7-cyano-7-deazaguanine synthase
LTLKIYNSNSEEPVEKRQTASRFINLVLVSSRYLVMRAVLVLSGGIDSFSAGAVARAHDWEIYSLSFDYQQGNRRELQAASKTAAFLESRDHLIMKLNLGLGDYGRSTLLTPSDESRCNTGSRDFGSYVPARNAIFLSCALGYAEVVDAGSIIFGASVVDSPRAGNQSAYRDCHPDFFLAFQNLARLGTNFHTEVDIYCPLLYLTKKEIVAYGISEGLDYGMTWSCYSGREKHCGQCKACELRLYAFYCLNLEDPAPYEEGFTHWIESYQRQWQSFVRW